MVTATCVLSGASVYTAWFTFTVSDTVLYLGLPLNGQNSQTGYVRQGDTVSLSFAKNLSCSSCQFTFVPEIETGAPKISSSFHVDYSNLKSITVPNYTVNSSGYRVYNFVSPIAGLLRFYCNVSNNPYPYNYTASLSNNSSGCTVSRHLGNGVAFDWLLVNKGDNCVFTIPTSLSIDSVELIVFPLEERHYFSLSQKYIPPVISFSLDYDSKITVDSTVRDDGSVKYMEITSPCDGLVISSIVNNNTVTAHSWAGLFVGGYPVIFNLSFTGKNCLNCFCSKGDVVRNTAHRAYSYTNPQFTFIPFS